jgi:hypothetical protein
MAGAEEDKLRKVYALLLAAHAGFSQKETERYIEFSAIIRSWTEQSADPGGSIDVGDLADVVKQHGLLDIWGKIHDSPILIGASQYQNEIFLDQVKLAAATRYGKPLPPLFAGEFPTTEMNGCILKSENGALILINSGLSFFLNHLSDLIAGYSISNTYKGHGFGTDGRDRRSRKVTVVAIANSLTWYLLIGQRNKLRRLPIPGEFQYVVSTMVKQETLKFVLAHEIAHATLGHINIPEPNPVHEFEADREAIAILRGQPIQHGMKEVEELHSEARLAGPIFFLSACCLIDAALSRKPIEMLTDMNRFVSDLPDLPEGFRYARGESIGVTHPPPGERLQAMWEVVRSENAAFDIARAYTDSLSDLEKEVLDNVEASCNKVLSGGD